MIFRPELVEKILAGQKTETRRRAKEGEPCRYEAGKTYALQPGRTKAGVARIRVTDVRREGLGDLKPAAAPREGFRYLHEFFTYWRSLYGRVDA